MVNMRKVRLMTKLAIYEKTEGRIDKKGQDITLGVNSCPSFFTILHL